jgi:hypothetical protein
MTVRRLEPLRCCSISPELAQRLFRTMPEEDLRGQSVEIRKALGEG